MKKNILKKVLIILLTFFLTQCKITYTTHDFTYYGNDSINPSRNFKYVKHNVIGKSSTTYNFKKIKNGTTFGDVDAGLIADAKLDMYLSHELKDNQAYANLTIDISRTRNAVKEELATVIVIDVVICADIIEYY